MPTGAAGTKMLDELGLDAPFQAQVLSLRRLIDAFTFDRLGGLLHEYEHAA